MARTWKDKPYKVMEREAVEHGCTLTLRDWRNRPRVVADIEAYLRRIHRHARIRPRHDYGEDLWRPSYGNEAVIRDRLHMAATAHNSMLMDADWDDPDVYRRRRSWVR